LATQAKRDYYEILSVSRTATEQEIKGAFLKLAAEYQARGKPANIEAVEGFRQVARAYRILGDPEQRRRYDQFGENGVTAPTFSSGIDADQLERLALSTHHGGWPVADAVTVKILDKLFDKE
jgi:molecular chaperone DnaJ